MVEKFVAACLEKRFLVMIIFGFVAIFGYYSYTQLSIEAYPDIADVTSQVITQYPGHAAEEVEEQITVPMERELNGIPGLSIMRSKSTFGLSIITLVFRDGVESYFSRQRINERIANVQLPDGANTGLDPLTSPIGEIYRYTIESKQKGQRELKELQQWVIVPTIKQVFGVADVTNFGGETTQFQLELNPTKLSQYGLSLDQVVQRINQNNANAGGSIMARGDLGYVVRGLGLVRSLDDLGNIVVSENEGSPIFVKDLGTLRLGALERKGVAGKNDNPDVVSGIVLLLKGENPSRVLEGVHEKIDLLNNGVLPDDVKIVPYLDRTVLVDNTVHTVSHTLLEGMGLVVIVLLLFLGSVRSALLVAITIPLALLIAFTLMYFTNIPANMLSLGAIDFGIIVDGAIVMMESILRKKEEKPDVELDLGEIKHAAGQVATPIFFATLIIITAYIPLFAFERVERKLFTPMAFTVGYALMGALLVALALIPGLAYAAYRKPSKVFHNRWLAWLTHHYHRLLEKLLQRPRRIILPAAGGLALAIFLSITVGKDFLPELDEGSIWLQVQLPPGITLARAAQMADTLRQATLKSKEITYMVTQLGRNDDGTDPWTPSHIECSVGLLPYDQWPSGKVKHDLIRELSARFATMPGYTVGFSQPMIDGVNDKISGAHSDLVVKVYGQDFAETRRVALAVVKTLKAVPGSADVAIDQEPPLPQLQIRIDREAAARYGINVSDIGELIEVAIGGSAVSQLFLGERKYDIAVRFGQEYRDSPEKIQNLMLTTPNGAKIPLSQVAAVGLNTGESTITREMNRRHLTVKLNLRGRDLSDFLAEAQPALEKKVNYDRGQTEIRWGGQFENQQRAEARLLLIVPVALAIMFVLLYSAADVRRAAMILSVVPLAVLGGMIGLHLRGMTLNVSSAVGFIALFGVAIQNGVIMVSSIHRYAEMGEDLRRAVLDGATERFRPVLMTATVAVLGLLPAALARGIGSDVQRPLATVIVFGLFAATLLTLFVLPAVYLIFEEKARKGGSNEGGGSVGSGGRTPVPALAFSAVRGWWSWLARPTVGLPVGLLLVSLLGALPARAQVMPDTTYFSSAKPARAITYVQYLAGVSQANLALAAQRFNVSAAELQIELAKLFPNPNLTVGNVSGDVSGINMPQQWYVGVDQLLELGGKRRARVNLARTQSEIQRLLAEDFFRSLRADATNAYANALTNELVLARKKRSFETLRSLVVVNQARLKAGDIGEVELVQSKVEAQQLLNDVLQSQGDLASSYLTLASFVGQQRKDTLYDPAGNLNLPFRKFDVEALVGAALLNRSDALAARQGKTAANQFLTLTRANRVPTADLTIGNNFYSRATNAEAPSPRYNAITATLAIPLPLSNALYRAPLRLAQLGTQQANLTVQQVELLIEVQVRQAVVEYESAVQQITQYQNGLLNDAETVLNAKIYSYKRGEATLLDLLNAQRTLDGVYFAYFGDLNRYVSALIAVEQSAGIWDISF